MRSSQFFQPAGTLLCASILVSGACSSSLDPSLDNRSCSADGECVDGYVCSSEHVCVRSSRSSAGVRVAADGGIRSDATERDVDAPAGSAAPVRPLLGQAGSVAGGAAGAAGSSGAAGAPPAAVPSGAPIPAGSRDTAGASGAAGATGAAGAAGAAGVAGSNGTAGASGAAGASTAPAPAANGGAPSTPPVAGRGAPEPLECAPGLDLCQSSCVDLATDDQHCGDCDKHCKDDRTCVSGKCEKQDDAPKVSNDVAALATLLALFGLDLSDLAEALGVDEDDLTSTDIKLDDLEDLGINEAALGFLGFTRDALGLIGIEVSDR